MCKTFLLSSEHHPHNVLVLTPKMHCGAIFQLAIAKTWQDLFTKYLQSAMYVFLLASDNVMIGLRNLGREEMGVFDPDSSLSSFIRGIVANRSLPIQSQIS